MSKYVLVCDVCGKETDALKPPTNWLYLTQPLRSYCEGCKPKAFNEDYFLRGQELGISGYTEYRWLPSLTVPMAKAIIAHCRIQQDHTILDFGCARGYLVKAFRELLYCAYGYDTSEWAIENADLSVYHHCTRQRDTAFHRSYDWVIAKDVLEHISLTQLTDDIADMMGQAKCGVFAVVPLSAQDNGPYVCGDYERDVTHIHRLTLPTWAGMFMRHGWTVEASYRVKGVKDNWYRPGYERGNGFITARRVEE